MNIEFYFTNAGYKTFEGLPNEIQERMLEKVRNLKRHPRIFEIVKRIDFTPATHRLRVGHYRLLLELKKNEPEQKIFWILMAGHRREVYRAKL